MQILRCDKFTRRKMIFAVRFDTAGSHHKTFKFALFGIVADRRHSFVSDFGTFKLFENGETHTVTLIFFEFEAEGVLFVFAVALNEQCAAAFIGNAFTFGAVKVVLQYYSVSFGGIFDGSGFLFSGFACFFGFGGFFLRLDIFGPDLVLLFFEVFQGIRGFYKHKRLCLLP